MIRAMRQHLATYSTMKRVIYLRQAVEIAPHIIADDKLEEQHGKTRLKTPGNHLLTVLFKPRTHTEGGHDDAPNIQTE